MIMGLLMLSGGIAFGMLLFVVQCRHLLIPSWCAERLSEFKVLTHTAVVFAVSLSLPKPSSPDMNH